MPFYRTCPLCGAHLDPGEACDCRDEENTADSSAKAASGKVEHVDHAVSTSNDNKETEDFQDGK